MRIDIVTIFPQLFENFLNEALIARAQEKKIVKIATHDLRLWTTDRHRSVDDRPYGGGAGMVLMVEPLMKAVKQIRKRGADKKIRVISMSAKGKTFNQSMARRWSKLDQLIILCGRYEGIDERVNQYIADEEVSIGNYVLFGGEVPAMVVMEAVTRLLPEAIGKKESLRDESFNGNFIEYPHYTRPEVIEIESKKRRVPKVLLSGNHAHIDAWRKKHSR